MKLHYMASVLNTVLNGSGNMNDILPRLWGPWEDVDTYESVVITISSDVAGTLELQWGNTDRTALDATQTDVIAVETVQVAAADLATPASTITRDHRGRWFRVKFTLGGAGTDINMSVNYKKSTTNMKIVSDTALVTVGAGGSFRTMMTDRTGLKINDTDDANEGRATFLNLRDFNGESMALTNAGVVNSLVTAMTDASGLAITTVGDAIDKSIITSMTNSEGVAQATTGTITGTATAGVANFMSLADSSGLTVSSFRTSDRQTFVGNSSYVALCSSGGNAHSSGNPLWVDISADPITGIRAFDFSTGVTSSLQTLSPFANTNASLYNLFIYNDGPTTVWLKLYDLNIALATAPDISPYIVQNIACGSKTIRDITFPHGLTFKNGLYVRSTLESGHQSTMGPQQNQVFVNGLYINYTF